MALKSIYPIPYITLSKISSTEEKLEHWRTICGWLEKEEYKSQQINQPQSDQSRVLDAQVHVLNLKVENEKDE